MDARARVRSLAAGVIALLIAALVGPTAVAASTPTYGVTLSAPTPAVVQYSDFVTLRGAHTCINGPDASGFCPTATLSHLVIFSLRPTGGSAFTTVATLTAVFTFAPTSSGCPTTCSRPFQVQWKAGRAPGSVTIPPGTYDLRVTSTLTPDEAILTSSLVITAEGTTTAYNGAAAGDEGTTLPLAALVQDADRGLALGSGLILPDLNLGASTVVTFALYDATNTTLVAGPVSGGVSGTGGVTGSPALTLPVAGTYQLRTAYLGNAFYAPSSDLDMIVANPVNAPPQVVVPGPVLAEATSPAGAAVAFVTSATDEEDEPDPAPACDWPSGATFPLGTTSVTCTATDSGGLTASASFSVTVMDTTAPSLSVATNEAPGVAGWYNAASNDGQSGVTVDAAAADLVGVSSLACTDGGTDVGLLPASGGSFAILDGVRVVKCAASDAAGNVAAGEATFQVDQTPPDVVASVDPVPAASGWWNAATGAPTISFACADATSGVATCTSPQVVAEGADQVASGVAADVAGNGASATLADLDVDLGPPGSLGLAGGGVADGGSYFYGFVPAGPTGCTAVDGISGVASCVVTGYSTAVGTHLLTAAATDLAGNVATATFGYEVRPWTLAGFARPVRMDDVNAEKAGKQVPLRFEIWAGNTQVNTLDALVGLTQTRYTCTFDGAIGDPMPAATRGDPRIDASGTFIVSWLSPAQPGTCWLVTLTTADGSSLSAAFRLR